MRMLKKPAVLLMCVLLLSACRKTPEKEIVIPRDNTEKVVYEASNEKVPEGFIYKKPSHVAERFAIIEDELEINIEADVNFPEIDKISVAKLVAKPFSQETADIIREYFMQDGILVASHVPTKADYEAAILQAEREKTNNGRNDSDEAIDKFIKELMEERENAPEENTDMEITDYSISGEDGLKGNIVINGQEKGLMIIDEKKTIYNTDMSTRRADEKYHDPETGAGTKLDEKESGMTSEQAISRAYKILEAITAYDMSLIDITPVYFTYGYRPSGAIECCGYEMHFMRGYGGMMPVRVTSSAITKDDKFEVSPPLNAELITLYIDEYGEIRYFVWENPIEIVETLAEHVDILPFEDIMERFRSFTKIQYAYKAEDNNDEIEVMDVFDISLRLAYLPIKNNSAQFMYAPCWFFAYDQESPKYIIFSAVDGASVSAYSAEKYNHMQNNS